MSQVHPQLTERQQREIDYHRKRAEEHKDILSRPFPFDLISSQSRRWWNAHWEMFTFMLDQDLKDKRVLVIGCGFGDDALCMAKLGAEVYAFDLSPESLELANKLAAREGLKISFLEMPAENLRYESDTFDCVVARDILHHVDIPLAIKEVVRVSKKGALFVLNEVYTHSLVDKIRHSSIVERYLYPAMEGFVYEGNRYITDDERKLTENDIAQIIGPIDNIELEKYFNLFVNRIVPDKFLLLNKLDRACLKVLNPIAHLLAGRVLIAGRIAK